MDAFVVTAATYLSAGLAMGLGAIGSALGEGYAAGRTLEGIARQPASRDTLVRNMLLGQAIAETPGIFALVMAMLLLFSVRPSASWVHVAALLGSGLAIGIGAFGSALGDGVVAGRANSAISRNPRRMGPGLRMMFVAQALCETTVIFALIVSVILLALGPSFALEELAREIPKAGALVGAGLCMGIGAIGPAFGISQVGGAAAESLTVYPEAEASVTRTLFVGAAVSETTSIYALIVAFLLIWVVPVA